MSLASVSPAIVRPKFQVSEAVVTIDETGIFCSLDHKSIRLVHARKLLAHHIYGRTSERIYEQMWKELKMEPVWMQWVAWWMHRIARKSPPIHASSSSLSFSVRRKTSLALNASQRKWYAISAKMHYLSSTIDLGDFCRSSRSRFFLPSMHIRATSISYPFCIFLPLPRQHYVMENEKLHR